MTRFRAAHVPEAPSSQPPSGQAPSSQPPSGQAANRETEASDSQVGKAPGSKAGASEDQVRLGLLARRVPHRQNSPG